jgi:serine/threonine protein kinase
MSAVLAVPPRIGRFELRRVLGRGAQSTVWLAHDPRLQREVALKLMNSELGEGLAEARTVAALNHPHIVPIFEADVHRPEGRSAPQSYLVFEYLPGATLAERVRDGGAMPARAAVELLMGVFDALAQAHAAGVVHRDLKPSNILIDGEGRARVTDFGIATRSGVATQAMGTPRYLAPETLAGGVPTTAADVFACGLLVGELVLGHPLVNEADAKAAMDRIARSPLALPDATPYPVDDGLRGIVQRALARDPLARYAHAGELRDALRAWLAPSAHGPLGEGETAPASAKAGALDFLLRRMRHKSDFPALSDSVSRIQRVAASEHESLGALAGEILKDVALTHKLLRLVNAASYRHAGGGSISTVSRAVALIGFAGVRNLAMSLVLVEHMNDKLHAQQIQTEFLRALMAGTLADELCPMASNTPSGLAEEAFLGAMFQNLGRLLCEFYFPEEAEQVRRLVRPGAAPARETPRSPMPEALASTQVLGLSYEDLGLGVARHWGLPDTLQRCMRAPTGATPAQPPAALAERLRWLAASANEAADALLHHEPAEAARRLEDLAQRQSRVLGVAPREVLAAVARSRTRLTEMSRALNMRVKGGSPVERLFDKPSAAPPGALAVAGDAGPDTLSPHALEQPTIEATLVMAPRDAAGPGQGPVDRAPAADPAAVLAAGIQDITNSMVEDKPLGEVLRMILETMYRALGLRRVVFCLRDAKRGELVGRFALGDDGQALAPVFRIALAPAKGQVPDLLAAVCLKGADTLISDATAANLAARLPAWYRERVAAPTFLLLPLVVKGAPIGLIYADKAQANAIVLGEKELSLLRTLRNQAVMAFRQTS